MDNQITGVNYILASSIENKDNEITLRNEAPKSEYSFRHGDVRENTLRNEPPLSEKQLRKDVPVLSKREEPKREESKREEPKKEVPKKEEPKKPEPKKEEPKKEEPKKPEPKKEEPKKEETTKQPEESKGHKKLDETGKITWDKTHFILAIEAGSNFRNKL